jgi:hypothetical protein
MGQQGEAVGFGVMMSGIRREDQAAVTPDHGVRVVVARPGSTRMRGSRKNPS